MAARDDDPERLDLTRFGTPEDCIRLAADGCPAEYTAVAEKFMILGEPLTVAHLVFTSLISRARALHEAIVREILAENPDAVLVLSRGMTELAALLLYLLRHPEYIEVVAALPPDRRYKRKSYEAIFHAIRDEAPGFKRVYQQQSDIGHFGPGAVYHAHSVTDDAKHESGWSDSPHWRSEQEFRLACAQVQELAEMVVNCLDRFGCTYLTPPYQTPEIGTITDSRPAG